MAVRFGGRPGRLISFAAAVLVAATVIGTASVATAQVQIDDQTIIIDLGGKVYAENCDPCHGNIANTDNYSSDIIFQHGYHQLIACSSCHTRFPHREQGTERPGMEGCFACHGVTHGPMGTLATGECADCHNTPESQLRPSWHTWDWAGTPHVEPGEKELQTKCMMCHDQAWCDDCHDKEYVDWKPEQAFIYDSHGGCLACHGDENLTKTTAGAPKSYQVVGVDESAHRDLSCQQCHPDYNYEGTPGKTPLWNINAGESCMACHDHDDQTAAYQDSIHADQIAAGNMDSATCGGCHGGHYIQRLDTDYAKAQLHGSAYRICARCHQAEYDSYDDYYHGAAYKRGASDAPACWDCHEAHGTKPAADPASTVSAENLPTTCGGSLRGDDEAACHRDSGADFTTSAGELIHQKIEAAEENPLRQLWSNIRSWLS